MSFISEAIEEASQSSGCNVTPLDDSESRSIRDCVESKYASSSGSLPLWERLVGEESKYDPDGWKVIGEFPCRSMVTIFFDKENEGTMYRVNSCNDVVKIISECPGFVFYVTDAECDFVLCHNDHDYLIGAGSAKEWVGFR